MYLKISISYLSIISLFHSEVVTLDSESSAEEFEDATDFNNSEYIFSDSPPVQPLNRHLSRLIKQQLSQVLKQSSLFSSQQYE